MNVEPISDSTSTRKLSATACRGATGRFSTRASWRRSARPCRSGRQTESAVAGSNGSDPIQGWIYDTLRPFAQELQMGNPAMMKAIGAAKKKSDRLDARKIADLVRCNLLPA